MHQLNIGWTPLHKFGHNPDVDTGARTVALQVRPFGGAWLTRELVDVSNAVSWDWTYPIWLEIGPKADIRIRVLSVSANNTLVSAGFGLALADHG